MASSLPNTTSSGQANDYRSDPGAPAARVTARVDRGRESLDSGGPDIPPCSVAGVAGSSPAGASAFQSDQERSGSPFRSVLADAARLLLAHGITRSTTSSRARVLCPGMDLPCTSRRASRRISLSLTGR